MKIKSRQILLFLGDIFLLYFSLLIVLVIRFWENFNSQIFLKHFLPFAIIYFFWLIIFYIFGFYDLVLFQPFSNLYSRLFFGLSFSLTVALIFFYLFPFFGITPKTILFLNILIFGILTFFWRKFFYSLFLTHFQKMVAILGKNPQSEELALILQKNPHFGYQFIDFLNQENFLEKIKEKNIDTLILAEKILPNSSLAENLYLTLPLKLNFLDLSQAYEIILEKIPIFFVDQIWFLENFKEREKGIYEKIKRVIDLVLASIILLFTLPIWPLIFLAIKLEDKGPIFYLQERIGKERKPFLLIKFRSMIREAEKEGIRWAEIEDERVTKVGRFLRRFHLDEIPQMINVLKGDISLVGPRPERPEFVEKLEKEIPHYHLRHLIKPGFTGWAQIKFRYARSVIDSFEKFQYDLYYLKNRSLFLDLRILLKTFQLFFRKE